MRKQMPKKSVAVTFGAALSALYTAPELPADIVPVSFVPGSVPYNSTNVVTYSVNLLTTDGYIGSILQFNDFLGKTAIALTQMSSIKLVDAGQSLSPLTFLGSAAVTFSPSATGTVYIGFRALSGNVGWFGMNLGGAGNPLVYNAGNGSQYGNAGETVLVGSSTAIPEPGLTGLALLACGAVGIRRRRQETGE
jgi:hypothetical protein